MAEMYEIKQKAKAQRGIYLEQFHRLRDEDPSMTVTKFAKLNGKSPSHMSQLLSKARSESQKE